MTNPYLNHISYLKYNLYVQKNLFIIIFNCKKVYILKIFFNYINLFYIMHKLKTSYNKLRS